MKNLLIVESPGKVQTIQKYLGKDFTVKASVGHIRDLSQKEMGIDIEHGFQPRYEIPEDKKKIVAELKKNASEADMVWLASDEDREGEAISWHLFDTLKLNESKSKRIVFHEITKDAILEAIRTPRSIDMNLVHAQQARRVLDRLVGFELSPVLWRKIQPKLSAGRVQSVALRLIVDREREIMAFKKEASYRIVAAFRPEGLPAGTIVKATLDTRFATIKEAEKFLSDSIGANFTIKDIASKEGVRVPAAPFTTSTLQQEASRKLHMSVSTTMRLAQSLYERGLITYMRTDSTNLSALALNTAKAFICENFGEEYSRTRRYSTHSKGAQEAHEAIRPTYIQNTSIDGTPQEKKIYDLIWKRTVASQMADAKVLKTDVSIESDRRRELFGLQATSILFDGFLKLYLEGTDDVESEAGEIILPTIEKGQTLLCQSMDAECKFSQPPYRYSDATLVKKLEELGIGRPSTYSPIITTLTTGRGYVTKGDKPGEKIEVENLRLSAGKISRVKKTEIIGAEKGKFLPQEIGILVTDYLLANFSQVMDYDFTANIEKDFDLVASGDMAWNTIVSNFYGSFHQKIGEVMSDRSYSNHHERELGTDPSSGLPVKAKFGQWGPFIQIGDGEGRRFAHLAPGQLIESITLEEALKLFDLPRTVGQLDGEDIVATKGRFGPYLRHAGKNYSLPRGVNPITVTLQECVAIIRESAATPATPAKMVIQEFKNSGIQVLSGRYGPYIKYNGANYKIPRGKNAAAISEENCLKIIRNAKK